MNSICKKQHQPLLFHIGIKQTQPSNSIKTTSYNILTFLPLATLVQFKRLANVYFLLTAVLQFIPAISPLSPISAIAPLIFVLTISLIRAAIQEIGKYKYDRQANSSQFLVYSKQAICRQSSMASQQDGQQTIGDWKMTRSDHLHVGDIIKIRKNERFPADIILLSTSNADGKVYIETSSLDGQKNLKIRTPLPSTQHMYKQLHSIHKNSSNNPLLTVQEPNEQLYNFNGLMQYNIRLQKPKYGQPNKKFQKCSQFLKINQFLYRESVLRNTQQIIGVVSYAGKFTKSMMNNSFGGRQKMSKLQTKVNFYMIFVFIFQLCLILLCGFLRVFLYYNAQVGQQFTILVLRQSLRSSIIQGILTSCSYFILLNTMIPISLLVSIQIVKFGQGAFIGYDKFMTRRDNKIGIIHSKSFRSSINEELGMVQYIFTDKTGTLTQNQMVLKEVIIQSQVFSNQYLRKKNSKQYFFNQQLRNKTLKNSDAIVKLLKQKLFSCSDSQLQGNKKSVINHQQLQETLMLLIMSTCHQCLLVPANSTLQSDEYHGSSPDQISLVDSAARIGFKFIQNCYGKIKISLFQDLNQKEDFLQFYVQEIFEFNSDRKRMSVILSHSSLKGNKILLCKGADSVMDKLLNIQYFDKTSAQFIIYEKLKEKITDYSKRGLRTLLFGYKIVSDAQFQSIKNKLLITSSTNLNTRAKDQLIQQLQKGLFLCGATAVQDKLQNQVPNVITDLIRANIKICMLTGDKLETAENIAKSCGIFRENLKIIKIAQGSSQVDVFKGYCEVKDFVQSNSKYGVIIQGVSIATALNSIYFSQILLNCQAAVCCRITPKNKAEVVNFAKNHLNKLVLSIGDGANDVPMIQAAHIGIGLYGNQGMNAVQASDFALPQFRCLWRLLFVHGRWNYIRIAQLIKYFFYKNMIFTLCQLWYAYICSFSAQSIYNATYLVLFNTIFTGGPVIVRALLQQDLNYLKLIQQIRQQQNKQKRYANKQLKQQLLFHQTIKQDTSKHLSSLKTIRSLDKQDIQNQIDKKAQLEDDRFYQSKKVVSSKLLIDQKLKQLYPLLYTHSQKQLSLTPRIFSLLIIQSIMESFGIFVVIFFGIQASQLWIFSICLYSVVLGLVTIRICYKITYWTWLMALSILLTSLLPYIAFVYIISLLQLQLAGTFLQIIKTPDFYLCLVLSLGVGAFIQGIFNVINKYYFPTVSQVVRKQWKKLQQEQSGIYKNSELKKINHRISILQKYKQISQNTKIYQKNSGIEIQMKQLKPTG